MPIRTKKWNDPAESQDGHRILVSRYRPRALPKEEETWDEWRPELGPSRELHARFYGKNGTEISWPTYRQAYLREMQSQRESIANLAARVASGETITLLCSSSCIHESRCHRSLLKELIQTELDMLEQARRHT